MAFITTFSVQSELGPQCLPSFWTNEKMLGGQKFASEAEVQSTICQWLTQQPASFFLHQSFRNLIDGQNV